MGRTAFVAWLFVMGAACAVIALGGRSWGWLVGGIVLFTLALFARRQLNTEREVGQAAPRLRFVGLAMLAMLLAMAFLFWLQSLNAHASEGPVFGELPDAPLSRTVTSGVRAEICQQHLVATTVRTRSLPSGYRMLTVADRAATSKQLRDLLLEHPEYATHGFGSLCFLEAESLVVNGIRVRPPGLLLSAFWWAAIVPTDGTHPRDARVRGAIRYAQLASWYAAEAVDRPLITASDPMAEYASIEIRSLGHSHWRVALSLPDGKVEGEIHGKGDRTRMYPGSEARFMTVASTGESAKYFTVYSYYGHYGESASGEWSSSGEAPVAVAARHTGAALGLPTEVQDSWQSLSGLYRSGR